MPRRPQITSRAERAGRTQMPAPPPQEFGKVPDPSLLRQFPVEHRGGKPIAFYPVQPERIEGDVLEIGPGRGDFLLSEAQAHPKQRFVAIEIGKKRHARLIKRLEKRDLKNVLLIQGDARIVLPRHVAESSFGSVVVLFPDPWPKRRHAFNRLLQPEFLAEIGRILKPDGHAYIKSDVESYIDWVRDQVADSPQFEIVDECWPWGPVDGQDGKTLSLFADRQTGFGYEIHSLCLRRTGV